MSSSSSSPPGDATPSAAAPVGGKGKDFARMTSSAAAVAAAAASAVSNSSSSQPASRTESPSSGKKGKDLARMLSSAAVGSLSSGTSGLSVTTTNQDGAQSSTSSTPMGKPKGKDLSRMGTFQRTSPSGLSAPASTTVSQGQVIPSSVQPKGKDLAAMSQTLKPSTYSHHGPSPGVTLTSVPLPSVTPTSAADIAEHTRRQNMARNAAGLPPINPIEPNHSSQLQSPPTVTLPLDARHEAARRAALGLDSYPPQGATSSTAANTSATIMSGTMRRQSFIQVPPMAMQPTNNSSTASLSSLYGSQTSPNRMIQDMTHSQEQQVPVQNPQLQISQVPLGVSETNVPVISIERKVQPDTRPTPRPTWYEARLWNEPFPRNSTKYEIPQLPSPTVPTTEQNNRALCIAPVLDEKLQKLCRSIDPSYTLDAEVQERLLEMADVFIDKVTKDAIRLARHRGSKCLDVVDVSLALKKGYGIDIPGLGPPNVTTASVSGQYSKSDLIGGWLFAGRVNAPDVDKRMKEADQKKRKLNENLHVAMM